MSIRGARAGRVFEEMLRQVDSAIQADVELTVWVRGRFCGLTARGPMSFGGGGSLTGSYGAWLPFLPPMLATRLAYVDLLETIQSQVSGSGRPPWPGPDCDVKASRHDAGFRLWFEGPDGPIGPSVVLAADFGR